VAIERGRQLRRPYFSRERDQDRIADGEGLFGRTEAKQLGGREYLSSPRFNYAALDDKHIRDGRAQKPC
jgi:hypothetical protein